MCRSIKPLFNLEPKATKQEVDEAALQFVRKISGYSKPSVKNLSVFEQSTKNISAEITRLIKSLETSAPTRTRKSTKGNMT